MLLLQIEHGGWVMMTPIINGIKPTFRYTNGQVLDIRKTLFLSF